MISPADVPYEWHAKGRIERRTLPKAPRLYSSIQKNARAPLIIAVSAQAVVVIILAVRRAQVPGGSIAT